MFTGIARWITISTISISLLSSGASADTLDIVGGQKIEGKLQEVTSKIVSIEVGGQIIKLDRTKVLAIHLGAAEALTRPTEKQDTSLREDAIHALRGLQSAIDGGVVYKDFGPRVTDAKIIVDRYEEEKSFDPAVIRGAVKDAMGYYILVQRAWSESIFHNGDLADLGSNPLVDRCTAATNAMASPLSMANRLSGLSQAQAKGFAVSMAYSSFLPCAAEETLLAENAAKAEK